MHTESSSRPLLLSFASALLLSLSLGACIADDASSPPRGSLGKADLVGSCEGSCDGPSATGTCWCDADCADIGDCCSDIALECPASVTTCGGFLGQACGPDEYCHYELDQMCGAADQLGVCVTSPQICNQIFDPVCGCDQQTYSSDCHAAVAGVSVLHVGDCQSICPDIVPPAPGFCSGDAVATPIVDANGCTIGFECTVCPQIEPPPPGFCTSDEVTSPLVDSNGCTVGFECVPTLPTDDCQANGFSCTSPNANSCPGGSVALPSLTCSAGGVCCSGTSI